jgi:hypothetical protein
MIVIMLPSGAELLTIAVLVLLAGLNVSVWARVIMRSRPARRVLHRFRRFCVLCKSPRHSMREHVLLPQAVLHAREHAYKPRQRILYAGAELNRLYPGYSISTSNHAV